MAVLQLRYLARTLPCQLCKRQTGVKNHLNLIVFVSYINCFVRVHKLKTELDLDHMKVTYRINLNLKFELRKD